MRGVENKPRNYRNGYSKKTVKTQLGAVDVIVQRIKQKPLPLGGGAEGQHRQNFVHRFLLADQFLRGGAVGQNALGGNYVLVTLAPVPMPPLLPVKAPLGALGQLPKLVESGGILIGQLAAVSLDGDLHLVVLLFRFGVSEI